VSAANSSGEVFFWGLVLIGAVCVLGVLVWVVRRWSLSTPASAGDGTWSLQHLREMKAQGQITNGEFESLKTKALEASRLSMRGDEGSTSAQGN
jgi:hypothetical protein